MVGFSAGADACEELRADVLVVVSVAVWMAALAVVVVEDIVFLKFESTQVLFESLFEALLFIFDVHIDVINK